MPVIKLPPRALVTGRDQRLPGEPEHDTQPVAASKRRQPLAVRDVVPTLQCRRWFLHVGRDRDKRRRLSEIAELRAGEDGRVRVVTAWHVDTGFGSAAGDLRNMLRDRGVL